MSGGWRQGDRLNPRLQTTPNLFPRSAGAQPTQPINTGTRQVIGGLFTPVFTNPITAIPQIAFRNISSDGGDMTITATVDFPYTFGPRDELRFILSNTTTQGTVTKDYRPADQYVIGDLNPGTYYDVTVIPKINGNVEYSISATSNILSSTVSPPGILYGLIGDVCDSYVNFLFGGLVPPLPQPSFIAVTTNFNTIPTIIPLALGSTYFVAGPYSNGVTYSLTLQPGVQAGNVFFYQEVSNTFGPFIPGPPGDPIITNIYASNTTVYFGVKYDTTVHPTPNYFKVTGYKSTSNLLSNIVGISGKINDLSTNYAGFFMSFQTIDPIFVSSLSGNNVQADITNELGLWYSFRISSITSNNTGYLFTNPNFVKTPIGGSNFNVNFYILVQGSVNISANLTVSGGILTLVNTPPMYTTFKVQTYANHLFNLCDDFASIYPGPPGQPSTPSTPPPSVQGNNCLLLTIIPPATGPRPVSYFYNPGNPSSVASISSYFTTISLTGLTNGVAYTPYVYTYANSVSSSYTFLNYLEYNTTPNIQPPTSISIANVNNTVVTISIGRPLGGGYQYLIEASGGPGAVDISLTDTGAPFLSGTFGVGLLTTGCGYTFTGYSLSTAVYTPNNLSTAPTSPVLYLGPPSTPTNISGYYRSQTVYLTGSAAGYVGTNQYFINDNYGNVYRTPFTRAVPNDLNTVITNLTDGSSYTFTVTACGNGLASAPSSPITFNLYTPPPTNPTLLFGGAVGLTAFVTFSGSLGGADTYIVVNGNNQSFVTISPGSTGTQTVTISFDTPAKNSYYYQIYAQKYGVNSCNSTATNTLYSGFPLPPNNLQGTVTPNQIVFTFSHDSQDQTTTQYYKIYEYYLDPKLDPKTDPNNGFVPSTKGFYTTLSSPFSVSAVATVSQSYTLQSGAWTENVSDLFASFTIKNINLDPPSGQGFDYYYDSNAVSFTLKQNSSSYTFVPTVYTGQATQTSNFANPIIPKSARIFDPTRSISLTWTSYQGPLNYGTYYYRFDTVANTVQSPLDTLSIQYAMFMKPPSVPTVVFSNTTATVSFINNAANISYHIVTNVVDGSTRRIPAVANLSAVFSGLTDQSAYSFYATTYAISTISAQGNPSTPAYAGRPVPPNITYTIYGTTISLQVLDPTLSSSLVFYDTGNQSIQNTITGTAHTSEINLSLGGNWTNSSTPPFYTSPNGFLGPASVTYCNAGVVNAYISLSTSIPAGSQLGIGLPIFGGAKYTVSLTSTQMSFFDYQNTFLYSQTISGNSFQIQRISNQFTVYNNGILVNTIPTILTSFIDPVIITSTGTSTFSYFGVSNTSTSGVQPSNYAITIVPVTGFILASTGMPQFYSIKGLTAGNNYTVTISSQGNQVYSLTNALATFYPHSVQPLPPVITISNVTVNLSVAKVVDNANPPNNEPDVYSVVASNTQTGIILTLSSASSGLSTYGFQFTGLVSQNLYSFYAYTTTNGVTCNSPIQQYVVGPPVPIQSVTLVANTSTLTTTTGVANVVVVPGGLTADTSYIISLCGSGNYAPYSGIVFTSTPFNWTLSNGDTYRAWVYPVRNNVVGTAVSSVPISFNPAPPSSSVLTFNTATLQGFINYTASPTTIGTPVQTFSIDGVNYSTSPFFQGVYGTIYTGFVKTTTNGLTSIATLTPSYNLFTLPPPTITAMYNSTSISLTWTSALQCVPGSRTPTVLPNQGYTVIDLCGNYTGFAANYPNTTLSLAIPGVLGKTYAFNIRAIHSNLPSLSISGNANTIYLTTNPVNTMAFQGYYGTNISMGWVEPVQLDGSPKPNGGYFVTVATNSVLSTPQFPNTIVPSYTFGNIAINSNYYYVITAIHNGVYSSIFQTPTVLVSTVTLYNVQQDYYSSNITVSWNFTGNADSFVVTDKLGNYSGSYTGTTGGASLTFSTGVQLSKLYQFGVAAVKYGVQGVTTYATNTISLYTIPPTNISADYSTYTMTVSWTAPSVVPNGGYYIYDANGNTPINTTTSTNTQFTVTSEKTYKFSVYALNKGVSSAIISTSISLFTYAPSNFTNVPSGLTIVNTWSASIPAPNGGYVLTDICGSSVSSKTGKSTSYPLQNDISDYSFSGSAGSYHDFTIYAINKGISSAIVKNPTMTIYAPAPSSVTMANSGTTVSINWGTQTNLSYTVGRYVGSTPIDFTPSLPYTGPTQYNYTGTLGSTYQFYVYSTNTQGVSSQQVVTAYYPVGISTPLYSITLSSAPIRSPPIAQWLAGPSIKVYYDIGVIYGDYIGTGGQSLPITAIGQTNDATPQNVYMIYDGGYTKMVAADGTAKYYIGIPQQFSVQYWSTYTVQNVGHYNLSLKSTMTEWDGATTGITYSISETNSFVTPVTSTAVRSNTFTPVTPNQTYTFNAAGIYNGLKSFSISSASITLTSTPPPTVTVDYTGTTITISWDKAYQIYDYSNYPTGGYVLSDLCNHFNSGADYTAGGSTATTTTVTGLPGVTYKFRVWAKHKDIPSTGTIGNEITLTIPGTPTLTLSGTGTSVTGTFNAVSPVADKYTLAGLGSTTTITSFPPYTGTLSGGSYSTTYTVSVTPLFKGISGTSKSSNITLLAPPTASCSSLGVITVNWNTISGATYIVNEYSNGTFQLSGAPSPTTNNQIQFNAAAFNGNTYTYKIVASTPNVTVTTLDSAAVKVQIVPGVTTPSVLTIDYTGTTITTTWTAEAPAGDTTNVYLWKDDVYTGTSSSWTTGTRQKQFTGTTGSTYFVEILQFLNNVCGAVIRSATINPYIPGTQTPTLTKSGTGLTVGWAAVYPPADTFICALFKSDGTLLETKAFEVGPTYSYLFSTAGVGNTTYYATVTSVKKGIQGTPGQSASVTVQAPGNFTAATLTYNSTTLTATWTSGTPVPDKIVGTLFTNSTSTGTTSNWITGTSPIQLQFTGTIGSNHFVQLVPSLAGVNGTSSNTNTVSLLRPYIVAAASSATYSGTTSTITSWQGTSPPDSTHPTPNSWTLYQYTDLLDTRAPAPITAVGGTVGVGEIKENVDRLSPYFVVGSNIVNAIDSTVKAGLQGAGTYGNYKVIFVGDNSAVANFTLGSAISTLGNGWVFSNSSVSKTSSNVFSAATTIRMSILNNAGVVTATSTSNVTVTSTTASFTGLTMGATYQYGIIAIANAIVSETTPTNFSPPSTLPISIPGSNIVLGIPTVTSTGGTTTVTWAQTTPAADTFVVNEFMSPVYGKQVFTPKSGAVLTNVKMPYGNYILAFTITLNVAATNWSNVLHISDDGTNDTRTPSFFVTYPKAVSTTSTGQGLHIRWGDTTNRNFGIDELGYLTIGVPTRVVMNAMGNYVNVTVGSAVSNVLQTSWVSTTNTGRPTGTNYSVYMSQPTSFLPAQCTITDIDYIVDGIPYIMTYPDPTYLPPNNNGYLRGPYIGIVLPAKYSSRNNTANKIVYGGVEDQTYIKWATIDNAEARCVTIANYNVGYVPSSYWNNPSYYTDQTGGYNYTQNYTTPVVDGTKFIPKANTCIASGIPSLAANYSLSFYLTLTSVNLTGIKSVFRLTNQPTLDYGSASGERTFGIWTDGGTGQSNVLFWENSYSRTNISQRSNIPIGVPTLIEYYAIAGTSVTIKVGGTTLTSDQVGAPINGPFSVFIGDSTFDAATTTMLTGMNLTMDGRPIISSTLPLPPRIPPLYDGTRIIPVSSTILVSSFPVTTGTYTLSFYLTLNDSNSTNSNTVVFRSGPSDGASLTKFSPAIRIGSNSSTVNITYNDGANKDWSPGYVPLSLSVPALVSMVAGPTQISMSITQQIAPIPIPQSSLTTPPVSGYDIWYDGSDPTASSSGTTLLTVVVGGGGGGGGGGVIFSGPYAHLVQGAGGGSGYLTTFSSRSYTTGAVLSITVGSGGSGGQGGAGTTTTTTVSIFTEVNFNITTASTSGGIGGSSTVSIGGTTIATALAGGGGGGYQSGNSVPSPVAGVGQVNGNPGGAGGIGGGGSGGTGGSGGQGGAGGSGYVTIYMNAIAVASYTTPGTYTFTLPTAPVITDGSVINMWFNKANPGTYDATSTAGATYSSSYNALKFNANLYTINYPANPSTSTIFAVFNNTGVYANANAFGLIGANALGGISLACGTSAGGGVGSIGFVNAGVTWAASSPIGSYKPGTTAIAVGYVNGSNTGVAVNGTDFSTLSNFTGTNALTSGTKLVLGYHRGDITTNAAYSYGYPFVGYVMEILIYPSVLTTTQIQQVQSYLSQKWSTRSQVVNSSFTYPTGTYRSEVGAAGTIPSASNVTITGLNYAVDGKTIIAPTTPINRVLMEQSIVTSGTTTTFSNVTPGSFQYQVIPYLSNDAGVYANQSCLTTPVLNVNVTNFTATGVVSPQVAASGSACPPAQANGYSFTLNWTPYTPPSGQSSYYTYVLYFQSTVIAPAISITSTSIAVSATTTYTRWGTSIYTLKIAYTNNGTTMFSSGAQTTVTITPTIADSSILTGTDSTTYTMPPGNYTGPTLTIALCGDGGGPGGGNMDGGGGGGGGGGWLRFNITPNPGETLSLAKDGAKASFSIASSSATVTTGGSGTGGRGSGGAGGTTSVTDNAGRFSNTTNKNGDGGNDAGGSGGCSGTGGSGGSSGRFYTTNTNDYGLGYGGFAGQCGTTGQANLGNGGYARWTRA